MALVAGQKLRVSDLTGGVSGGGGDGGGGGGVIGGAGRVLAANVTVNNSNSFTDALALDVVAGATYRFEAWLLYTSGSGPDIKFQPSTPSGTTGAWSLIGHGRDASPAADAGAGTVFNAADIGTSLTVAGDSTGSLQLSALAEGVFTTAGSGGTFKVRVGQRTATASNTILRAGSALTLTRIA